jgi:hypothetical protein
LLATFPITVNLRLLAVALLCLAAGCADLRWQRRGTDAATREVDLEECRQQARAQSARLAWPFPGDPTRVVAYDRAGRAVLTPYPYPTWLDTDRAVRESELVGECMRRKGYALTPAEQTERP